ncbi:amidase [Georgenia sp. H159]|uniref:amidase n=1 Tax=Georgenia sp. H159 TaxID=3076115 RepID=UPI002D77A77B|nr:amidase [Georgenia sp. H159]
MTEIHELSALDLAAAVRSGEVGPDDVVEHTLDRAERLGPAVGAFAHLTPELAREQAADATGRLREGGELPPFLGVPVPVKDLTMVAGQPFEAGSAAFRGYVAPADDGVTIRLREAGTLMVGKTTTPELGLPPYTEPDVAPPARTPWDPRRSAGGSSGGAAAAVAAGIVPAAHGSDGGGSIRIPASACGLVGLKPSRGRVSKGPLGVDGAGLTVDGVVTRTVRDTAAFLDVLSRPWPGDHYRLAGPRDTFLAACDRPPQQLQVGVLTQPVNVHEAPIHPSSLAAVDRAVRLLEAMGHEVTTTQVPFSPEEWDSFAPLWSVGALSVPIAPDREELLVPLTRAMRERGRSFSGLDYATAVSAVQQLARKAAAVWADLDVVLTPALATPPPFIGQMRNDEDPVADFEAQKAFTPWTSPWNMLGAPAIAVPLHRAEVDGVVLPVGVQLGATRTGEEELLLGLAAALEEADPWPTAPVEPA